MALIDEIREAICDANFLGKLEKEWLGALLAYHDAAEQYDWDALAAARKKLGDE